MSDAPLLRTPLYENHLALGAKMVPFAGWEMPVQYTGIVPEHQAVRKAAGVFDISHMGQFIVSGDGALAFLNRALTNDVAKLELGQGQYSLMLNEAGGVIDDLILYRTSSREFFLVVNASKIDEDWAHLRSHPTASYKERQYISSKIHFIALLIGLALTRHADADEIHSSRVQNLQFADL